MDYMSIPTRAEIKEKIYLFLKKGVDGAWDERMIDTHFQYHNIQNLSNDIPHEPNDIPHEPCDKRKLGMLFLEAFNDISLNGIIARKREPEFFFLTEKGKQFLLDQDFDVHDPDLYLKNLVKLNSVAEVYITESIHAFNKN